MYEETCEGIYNSRNCAEVLDDCSDCVRRHHSQKTRFRKRRARTLGVGRRHSLFRKSDCGNTFAHNERRRPCGRRRRVAAKGCSRSCGVRRTTRRFRTPRDCNRTAQPVRQQPAAHGESGLDGTEAKSMQSELVELFRLKQEGYISAEEYEARRKEILEKYYNAGRS